jgi:hypothetical protein
MTTTKPGPHFSLHSYCGRRAAALGRAAFSAEFDSTPSLNLTAHRASGQRRNVLVTEWSAK